MSRAETDHEPSGPPPGVRTMALVRWVLVIVTALVATGSILSYAGVSLGSKSERHGALFYCPMHPSVVQDHPGECPICSMTLVPKPEGKVQPSATMKPATAARGEAPKGGKYYCPMHPSRTSDDPKGKCPDCGMRLEPRPATEPAVAAEPVPGLSPIDLTPERIQLIGMRTATARRQEVTGELRVVGVVGPSERGIAQVTTRFGGWLQSLQVAETGARVRRGQVLASVYSPDVLRAEQELLVAQGWTSGATRSPPAAASHDHDDPTSGLAANARRRLELLGVSETEIDEVLRRAKASDAIAVRSPVDGYIVNKPAVPGLAIAPGTVLFEIADLSTVWVMADVPELDAHRIRVGGRARFSSAALPGETFAGKISFISPIVDSESRTLRLRLELRNRFDHGSPRLKPGTYGNVDLDLPPTTGLMVPAEAVVDTGETHYLFVAREGGRFEPRTVTLGGRVGDRVVITSGVAEGEIVVTTGNFLLDSESRLRAAIEGQTAAPQAGAASPADACARQFDADKFPDKVRACRACEVQHRGMGTMEDDCKNAIPKPWR